MLSLVAGPTDIVDPVAGNTVIPGTNGMAWVEGLGLLFGATYNSTVPYAMYAANTDGYAFHLSDRGYTQYFGWSYDDLPMVGISPSAFGRILLPVTMWALGAPEFAIASTCFAAALADRVIAMGYFGIGAGATPTIAYNNSLSNTLRETARPAAFSAQISSPMAPANIAGGKSLWWVCDYTTGKLFQYDAVAKKFIAGNTTFGSAILGFAYSRKHDLFFVVRIDKTRTPNVGQLYVYANEPVAANISAPVFAATPAVNGLRSVSCAVTGDQGEICAGRNVTFSVTGGSIVLPTVATDATGTATTQYQAPGAAAAGLQITATMTE